MTGRDPFDNLAFNLSGPNGIVIGVPAIALLILYSEKECAGKRPLTVSDKQLSLIGERFTENPSELLDWARSNCSWQEVCAGSVIVKDLDESFYESVWQAAPVTEGVIQWTET